MQLISGDKKRLKYDTIRYDTMDYINVRPKRLASLVCRTEPNKKE